MDEHLLETTLEDKYHIIESLLAEGTFILVDMKGNAISGRLIRLGINGSFVILADVVWKDPEVSLVPLITVPLESVQLLFKNKTKRILVKGVMDWIMRFELCSSEDREEVWEQFKIAFRRLAHARRHSLAKEASEEDLQLAASTSTSDARASQTRQPHLFDLPEGVADRRPSWLGLIQARFLGENK